MANVTKTEKKERRAMITINEDFCKGCGLCVATCPQHLIKIANRISQKGYFSAELVDPEGKCTGCALCAVMCPDVAIEVFKAKKQGRGEK